MTAERGALGAVGVRGFDEEVYRAVLVAREASPGDLADRLGERPERVRRSLARLRELGLVSRLSGARLRYTAAAPETALEALIRNQSARLQQVRTVAAELDSVFHSVARADDAVAVESLGGTEELGRWFVRLQQQVREEMLVLDRPPYALAATNPVEPTSLANGVRWRAIYAPEALEQPGALAEIEELADRGENARVLPGLRIKLAIADRRVALLPLRLDPENMRPVLIRDSTLLDALLDLFEHYWTRALPLSRSGAETGSIDPELLALLISGFKDDAIARQLGLSTRTMRRRMRRLMDELSADNRFQAGVQAAHRGWV